MSEQLSSRKRFFAWCGIVAGAAIAVSGAFILVAGQQWFSPFANMLFGIVLLTDCVLRLRGPVEDRGKVLRRRAWAATYLLWVASMLWSRWQDPIFTQALLVGIAMMGLTMGMLYLALLVSGALSQSKQ